jgi:hypothetical protein
VERRPEQAVAAEVQVRRRLRRVLGVHGGPVG